MRYTNPRLLYFTTIIMKFLQEQDMVRRSDELEDGCIPMRCGWWFNVSDVLVWFFSTDIHRIILSFIDAVGTKTLYSQDQDSNLVGRRDEYQVKAGE